MPRNLALRVECVPPVTDPDLTGRLQEILDVMLADNLQAWELSEDGSWHRRQPAEGGPRAANHKPLREVAPRPRGATPKRPRGRPRRRGHVGRVGGKHNRAARAGCRGPWAAEGSGGLEA